MSATAHHWDDLLKSNHLATAEHFVAAQDPSPVVSMSDIELTADNDFFYQSSNAKTNCRPMKEPPLPKAKEFLIDGTTNRILFFRDSQNAVQLDVQQVSCCLRTCAPCKRHGMTHLLIQTLCWHTRCSSFHFRLALEPLLVCQRIH